MKEQLKKIITTHPMSWLRPLKNKLNRHIYDMLIEIEEYAALTISEKIYWYLNDLHEYPKCKICGNRISAKARCNPLTGYATQYCSIQCAMKDEDYKKKKKQSLILHYGVDSYAKSAEFKKRMKEIKEKRTDEQRAISNEKRKATCLKRYGTESISKCKHIKDKAVKTYNSKSLVEKTKIQEKIKNTKIKKYGEKYAHEIMKGCINIGQQKASYQNLLNCIKSKPLFTFDQYLHMKRNKVQQFMFECNSCHKTYASTYVNGIVKNCPYCGYLSGKSESEKELANFIQQLDNNAITNTRKIIYPLELDVYSVSKKLAFEFDGLYWHNSEIKGKTYHINKTKLCEQQGIQLIHVFESEWLEKNNIVKSRIKNLFGQYDKTVYARKCDIREVNTIDSKLFQLNNHIQGPVNSKVNLGLYLDEELISLMTFGKCRFDKKHEWELLRFCNKLGYHIPGAAGKLLKHFERKWNPKSLVSYADRRWSIGKLYEALGFTLEHVSPPNYWYVQNNTTTLQSRIKFQKHKLKEVLQNFDENLSEIQNMKNNGYLQIYDCGNLVFTKQYQQSK